MSSDASTMPPHTNTILLVEDDEALLFLLSEQLKTMGVEVVPVSSGDIAWQMIEDGLKFDLLVSDVVMPGSMGGFELTRRMQRQDPSKRALLLSGYGSQVGRTEEGADAVVLQKTTPPDVLRERIGALMAQAE